MTIIEAEITGNLTNNKPLAGKVAIVTGGSRGIGAEIAKELARNGAQVAINYQSRADSANSVVDQRSKKLVEFQARFNQTFRIQMTCRSL